MSDVDKLLRAYKGRIPAEEARRYSLLQRSNLAALHERERVLMRGLARHGFQLLGDLDILEVGCGSGGELARLISYGADPGRLTGLDIRPSAVELARRRTRARIELTDASSIGHPDRSFDLTLQFTAFSSMLAPAMRSRVAREMVRVTRPGGLVVSYDFMWNPRNHDTVGISRGELRRLFPDLQLRLESVTLAQPLARSIGKRAAWLLPLAASLPLLRSHLLAFIDIPTG